MTAPVDEEALETAIGGAVADVMAKFGRMPTRWVLVAESLDDSGDRRLGTFTSPGLVGWESVGLLAYAQTLEQAAALAAEVRGAQGG